MEEFWQQNRRWLLGVGVGLVLFLVGRELAARIFDGQSSVRRLTGVVRSTNSGEFYDREDLDAARSRSEGLDRDLEALRAAVCFAPGEEFLTRGKGDLDVHADILGRQIRGAIRARAQEQAVELDGGAIVWTTPVGVEAIAAHLVGLQLLRDATERLFAASEEARARDPLATGLVAIESLRLEDRPTASRRGRRARRGREPQAEGLREHRVSFRLRCDAPTATAFLERLRSESPVICIDSDGFSMTSAGRGEPLLVQGRLIAVVEEDA